MNVNAIPSSLLAEIFSFSTTLDICYTFAIVSKSWYQILQCQNVWKTKWVTFRSVSSLKQYIIQKNNIPLMRIQILFPIYCDLKKQEYEIFREIKNLRELKFSHQDMHEENFLLLHSLDLPITELIIHTEFAGESLKKVASLKLKRLVLGRWNTNTILPSIRIAFFSHRQFFILSN